MDQVKEVVKTKRINPVSDDVVSVFGLEHFNEEKKYWRFKESDLAIALGISDTLASLVKHPAGGMIAFYSNTKSLTIHAKLTGELHMAHMTHVGQAGFDLYLGKNFKSLSFHSSTNYNIKNSEFSIKLYNHIVSKKQLFLINLPLYSGVSEIELEIDDDAMIERADNLFKKGKILIYGTSIVQGGCASRPGMSYPAIISRELGYEVLNYGFSGSAKAETEIANIIASSKDVKLFILDYEANAGEGRILENTLEPFIKSIRKNYEDIPILVISKIRMASEYHYIDKFNKALRLAKFQCETVERLKEAGDANIYFLNGKNLLIPFQHEATVDGTHPTDLGFSLMARRIMMKILSIVYKK